jgi:hypothetical protein
MGTPLAVLREVCNYTFGFSIFGWELSAGLTYFTDFYLNMTGIA